MNPPRRVLLSGLSGDAHFVGLTVLRAGLERANFEVSFLGAQNSIDDICREALTCEAVLVSNMDGHALYYLDGLREAQRDYGVGDRLWYLGGYPSLDASAETLSTLERLGFDRVIHGYIEISEIINQLSIDLASRPRRPGGLRAVPIPSKSQQSREEIEPVLPHNAWSPEVREETLFSWYTGFDARDFSRNVACLSDRACLADVQEKASLSGTLLVQPRTGVHGSLEQGEIFSEMADAGADVLSFQIDSLTRNNRYDEVEKLLKEDRAERIGASFLNGYPAVNLGVEDMARMSGAFPDIPFQVRHSTRDPRLLAEISFAAGVGAFEGGALSYNLPYFADYPIRSAVESWSYVDQLAGFYYREFGVVIDREFFGVLTACLVPPAIAVVVNVFEALMAAEAGVKAVSLGYAEQGHRAQDLAAVSVLRSLTRETLRKRGYGDVRVEVVWHQFMGPFPSDRTKAREILRGSAISAAQSDAVRLMLKTDVEGLRIPSSEDNANSLRFVKQVIERERQLGSSPSVAEMCERQIIEMEAKAILERAFTEARGDVSVAVQCAVREGWLDVPFSPSKWNAGQVAPLRDRHGAVRLATTGNLPYPPELLDMHRSAIDDRMRHEGRDLEELIASDVSRTARGNFDEWPLG